MQSSTLSFDLVAGANNCFIKGNHEIVGFLISNTGNANNAATIEIIDDTRNHFLTPGGLHSDFCGQRPFFLASYSLPVYQVQDGTLLKISVTEYGSVGTVAYKLTLFTNQIPKILNMNSRKPQILGFRTATAATASAQYKNRLELPRPFLMTGINVIHTVNVAAAKTVNQNFRITVEPEQKILPPLFKDLYAAMLCNDSVGVNNGPFALGFLDLEGYLLEKQVAVTFEDFYASYAANTGQMAMVNLIGVI